MTPASPGQQQQQHPIAISGDHLQALETLLAAETETYRLVASAMENKKMLLAEGRYHQLSQVDQTLVGLGQKTLSLEQERLHLMQQMGHHDKTLKDLLAFLAQGDRERLSDARRNLLGVIEQINLVNQENKKLLYNSLKWVEETMDAIHTTLAPAGTSYTAVGDKARRQKHNATNPIQSTVIRDA